MNTKRRILTAAIWPFVLAAAAEAQLSITDPFGAYTIDFDNTVVGVNNGSWAGAGFDPAATVAGSLDSNAWAITGFDSGALAFGGVQMTSNTDFTRGLRSAPVTTGGIYAFSGGSITGVALGVQPTGTDATPGTITLRIRNDSPHAISGFTLDYVVHVRDDAGRANVFNFSHSADDTNYLNEPSLNFSSTTEFNQPAFAAANRSLTFSGLNVESGAFYYLRWNLDDAGGVDTRDEFALDDIRLSAFDTIGGNSIYWDPAGSAPGVGGPGTWSANGAHFNLNELGTDAAVAMDPARRAVFAGTAGVVTIGSGAVANAGLEFAVDGYVLQGNALLLGGAAPTIRVTNAADTAAIQATLSGSAGFRKMGPGTLILGGQNDFSGSVIIQDGTLEIASDDALGLAVNPVQFNGGTLRATMSVILDSARALSGTGALDIAPGATLTVPGTAAFSSLTLRNTGTLALTSAAPSLGAVTFAQAATIELPNGTASLQGNVETSHFTGTSTIAGSVNVGNAVRTVTVLDGTEATDLRITGNVSASGSSGRLHKLGDGTLELLGNQSGLQGGIRLGTAGQTAAYGGVLHVHTATAFGAGEFQFNEGVLVVESETAVVFSNAVSIGGGQLGDGSVFAGTPMEFTGAASLFRPANTTMQHRITALTDVTFSGGLNASQGGVLGVSTGLTIAGTGTVHLPHPSNSIGESITVDGAHLNVTGGLINVPTITVRNGGRLSGGTNSVGESGEVVGRIVVEDGGVASPGIAGDVTGTLDSKDLTLLAGGGLELELEGVAPGEFDQFAVAGVVELGGELTLTLAAEFAPGVGDVFAIILNDEADTVVGEFAGLAAMAEFKIEDTTFQIDYAGGDGNDVVLTVVPEPSAAALLLAGAVLFARRRRMATGIQS